MLIIILDLFQDENPIIQRFNSLLFPVFCVLLKLTAFEADLLFGGNPERNPSMPRTVKLTEKNGLPCAQNQFAPIDKNRKRNPYDAGFNMGRRIALAVMVVSLKRNQPVEVSLNISLHCRIGSLVYGNSGSSMGNKNIADAAGFSGLIQNFLHLCGNVDEFSTFPGPDIDIPDHLPSSATP
jgi:hypothetical protein